MSVTYFSSLIKPYDVFFYKVIKFGLVGCSGLIIDFGITYLLKEKVGIHKYIANAISFFIASISNFIVNKIWTFEDNRDMFFSQYIIYFFIALGGLIINQLALYMAHDHFNMGFYRAKIIATLIVVVWNFTLNYSITFS